MSLTAARPARTLVLPVGTPAGDTNRPGGVHVADEQTKTQGGSSEQRQPPHSGDGANPEARAPEARAPERRQNARLRLLVDEMLKSIRESQRRDDWTETERERAEADLERIMAQVRRAAVDPDR
jgi:hypothetical protein